MYYKKISEAKQNQKTKEDVKRDNKPTRGKYQLL